MSQLLVWTGGVAVLFIVGVIVPVWCQEDIDLNKLKESLPPGVLPDSLNGTTLPKIDDVKKLIMQKCEAASGTNSTYEAVEVAANQLKDCVTGLVDYEVIQKEIEDAQPNGELDTVFNKYCRKRNIAIECMHNFTISMEPCLDAQEIEHKTTFVKIFTNLLNFVCHKDGDQIALFIAEKGPECFTDKKDALINCVNSTFSGYVPSETPTSLATLPKLVMGAAECADMTTLQTCVVNELEKCVESTPANLVESMFRFVRNETPCANMTTARLQGNGADSIMTSLTLISTMVLAVFWQLL